MLRRSAALLPLLAALLPGLAASAEEPELEGWAYELSGSLMSPYCPGRTLSECPSEQAQTLRMWLLVQEAAGRSRADVLDELYEQFGDQIRAAPRAEGFGLAAYAIPLLAFLGGGVLVLVFLRRQTARPGRPETPVPAAGPLDPELERLVDEDLAQ